MFYYEYIIKSFSLSSNEKEKIEGNDTGKEKKIKKKQEASRQEIKSIKNESEAWKFIKKRRGKNNPAASKKINVSRWKNHFKELLQGTTNKPKSETPGE